MRRMAVTFARYRDGMAEVVDEQGTAHPVEAQVVLAAGLERPQPGQSLVVEFDASGTISRAALPGGELG